MFGLFGKKEKIYSIDAGEVIDISAVPDQVFSAKMVGDGFALIPETGEIKAPVTGEVVQVFPTGHALGIKSEAGVEILIHIGIDTVELGGEGFDLKVKMGDFVSQGDVLVKADLDFIKSKGKSIVTPIVFTSKDSYKEFEVKYGRFVANSEIGTIKL